MLSIDGYLMGAYRIGFSENVGNLIPNFGQDFSRFNFLGTVHKCGGTHSTLMGGGISSYKMRSLGPPRSKNS